jgi:penicillin-binding protein 1C
VRLCAAAALAWACGCAIAQPSFDAVRSAYRPSDVAFVDRHGELLQTLRIDDQVRRLPWLRLDELSPALQAAIVVSEDRRFWLHSGIDWQALARSAISNSRSAMSNSRSAMSNSRSAISNSRNGFAATWNHRTQGASTVTMQLAALLDPALQRPAGGRSVAQKAGQMLDAGGLEARWTKAQILEAYLNLVPLRGEIVGVNAGSQMLFGRHPSGLDTLQAATMAVLVRAPNAQPAAVSRRACELLRELAWPCDGLDAVVQQALQRRSGPSLAPALAPHAAREVLSEGTTELRRRDLQASGSVRTTLDAVIQRQAIAALNQQLAELQGRQVSDGAVIVLDNFSGDVLAWVGAAGDGAAASAEVDAVLARRQSGSALKPFVYALAFEQRLITPASLIEDAPLRLAAGAGTYAPQNYDRDFKGWVSARVALASSLNVPAVRVSEMVGVDALFDRLNAFGLRLSETGGFHGPALALGSADVTLADLANAYRALANGGQWSPWRLLPSSAKTTAPRRVADAAAVFLVTDILADNTARATTFGWDSALVTRGFAAVKTGTSKDMRDNWCIGFTDRYTVGVWVGNANGEAMRGVSGTSGAAPAWRAIVQALHAGRPSISPAPPPNVVRAPPSPGWFIAGTEPPEDDGLAPAPIAVRSGIESPLEGSRYAIDPDMPPAAQRLVFSGEPGRWRLDGRWIGSGARVAWPPWPGAHRLELVAADGRVIDSVRFEVRGAGLVRPATKSSKTAVPWPHR